MIGGSTDVRDRDSVREGGGDSFLAHGKSTSLLATVEAIFNLGTLGRNDTSATPMSDLFGGGIR